MSPERAEATATEERLLADALRLTPEQGARVGAMLAALDREASGQEASSQEAPQFWDPANGEQIMVPVDDAEIRVIHVRPERPQTVRPVVFIPGWGVVPQGFQEFYAALHGKAELYYIETREKASSRILSRKAELSVPQSARDIQTAIEAVGLRERGDFVLMGTCWGSAIILQGLIDGVIEAPTIVAVDPMHRLWFPQWILRYVSPITPVFVTRMIKPILRRSLIGDMKEKNQKRRIDLFIDEADVRKWKRSADAAVDFELFGRLGGIGREVFVLNGTTDKVHDQKDYPRIARELRGGRFLYLQTDESQRERLMALAALEFARVGVRDGIPPALATFEKPVR
jgi:pimeloyl-ACP methyl ester carboxylesterase